jgi:spore maturation protein CgeB
MKIMLVGVGLSHHVGSFFNRALKQLDLPHMFFDEWRYFSGLSNSVPQKIWRRIIKHPFYYQKFNFDLYLHSRKYQPDYILVTQGLYINPETLQKIKSYTKAVLINYATDDPFNPNITTPDLVACVPIYDLYVCTKRRILTDIKKQGCKSVAYVQFGFDPAVHYVQSPLDPFEISHYSSDLLFIGGADPDRVPMMQEIISGKNINIHLYGIYWNREKTLKEYYYGFAYDDVFRKAHAGTKIGLSLVRRANRDGHSMRSFEIPACGAFLLTDRTEEHQEIFREDRDAVFFSDISELKEKIRFYLQHEELRHKIAETGHHQIHRRNDTYQDRVQKIFNLIQ